MNNTQRTLWLPLCLVAAALLWKLVQVKGGLGDVLPNFAPWMALSFVGAALLPKQIPSWLWAVMVMAVDVMCFGSSALSYGWAGYACYLLAGMLGGGLRQRSAFTLVGGTLVNGLLFYVVTNTQAWLMSDAYAKSAAGWLQALTVGDPRFQPQTWVFGLSSLVSDLCFAVLLVLAFNAEAMLRKTERLALYQRA
jgi:hypothetical protein